MVHKDMIPTMRELLKYAQESRATVVITAAFVHPTTKPDSNDEKVNYIIYLYYLY